jgi:hypothetical protein
MGIPDKSAPLSGSVARRAEVERRTILTGSSERESCHLRIVRDEQHVSSPPTLGDGGTEVMGESRQ